MSFENNNNNSVAVKYEVPTICNKSAVEVPNNELGKSDVEQADVVDEQKSQYAISLELLASQIEQKK